MSAATANRNHHSEADRVPLSDATFSVKGGELLLLERVTDWGLRIEYIDLSLRRSIYAEYVPLHYQTDQLSPNSPARSADR